MVLDRATVAAEVKDYIRTDLLGEPEAELALDAPLLEWGLLNSLNISRLIVFVNDRYGVEVPPEQVVGRNFQNIGAVADMVVSLPSEASGTTAASGQ